MEERNGEAGQGWQGTLSCGASCSNLSSLRDSGNAGLLDFNTGKYFRMSWNEAELDLIKNRLEKS